jgi:predicted acylesterase/phospholipase RssA
MSNFKILSIDGGGIRGIIPAHWLVSLEAKLKQANKDLSLFSGFDLIAGTSTGAIIAAGLAIGKSPDAICSLYRKNGRKIFPSSPLHPRIRGAFWPTYDGKGLDSVLQDEFGTKRLGEVKKRLLIVAFKGGSRTLKVFDSESPEDMEYLLSDVLRASCAAPTFLPAKLMKLVGEGELKQPMLDGGLAANNPAALALAEAFMGGHPPAEILLVSLGTGVSQSPITIAQGKGRGWVQWARPIIDVVFDGSSSANENLVKRVLPPTSYFRLQKRDLSSDPALDRADSKHLEELEREAQRFLDHEAHLFQQLVDALTRKEPPPALPLDGIWRSEYTWTESVATPSLFRSRLQATRFLARPSKVNGPCAFEGGLSTAISWGRQSAVTSPTS